eukprot:m.94750 g.94750  ORF g.94750 m.94750 type:complete len:124 (-) comp26752_c0_seq4:1604-1975(-)
MSGISNLTDNLKNRGYELRLASLRGCASAIWNAGPQDVDTDMQGLIFDIALATLADHHFVGCLKSTLSRHVQTLRKFWSADDICDSFGFNPHDGENACASQIDITERTEAKGFTHIIKSPHQP